MRKVVAGLACYRPGRRSRLIYRLHRYRAMAQGTFVPERSVWEPHAAEEITVSAEATKA